MSGFHGAFATGVASQQGTLTLPDTWFRPPFWDLPVLQLLRPNSSNLPCLYSTFHLEYPLVLSRFCSGILRIGVQWSLSEQTLYQLHHIGCRTIHSHVIRLMLLLWFRCIAIWSYRTDTVSIASYLMQNNKFSCNDTYMYLRFDTGINTCNKSNVLFMKVYCNLVIQNIHYINYMTEQ